MSNESTEDMKAYELAVDRMSIAVNSLRLNAKHAKIAVLLGVIEKLLEGDDMQAERLTTAGIFAQLRMNLAAIVIEKAREQAQREQPPDAAAN